MCVLAVRAACCVVSLRSNFVHSDMRIDLLIDRIVTAETCAASCLSYLGYMKSQLASDLPTIRKDSIF